MIIRIYNNQSDKKKSGLIQRDSHKNWTTNK